MDTPVPDRFMIVLHFYFLCLITPGLLTAFTFIRNTIHLYSVVISCPATRGQMFLLPPFHLRNFFLQRLRSGRTPLAPSHPISCTCRRWKDVWRKCPVINLMSIRAELFFSPPPARWAVTSDTRWLELRQARSALLPCLLTFVAFIDRL